LNFNEQGGLGKLVNDGMSLVSKMFWLDL